MYRGGSSNSVSDPALRMCSAEPSNISDLRFAVKRSIISHNIIYNYHFIHVYCRQSAFVEFIVGWYIKAYSVWRSEDSARQQFWVEIQSSVRFQTLCWLSFYLSLCLSIQL
mmetsp:Transcript_1337/g.3107  ORF Transcript_1337/g.3107 Transcript_1337/m.3107 type:complete len:111 (-) Transcript_1337:514-846(-)